MKIVIIKFLMLSILTASAYRQKVAINIRFIHGGEELKPVGTLLINTVDTIKPNDKESDKYFGISIKTDTRSFKVLDEFLKHQYLTKDNTQLKGSNEYYVIKYSNGLRLFLIAKNINNFFSDLRAFLKKEHIDKELTKAFDYY